MSSVLLHASAILDRGLGEGFGHKHKISIDCF